MAGTVCRSSLVPSCRPCAALQDPSLSASTFLPTSPVLHRSPQRDPKLHKRNPCRAQQEEPFERARDGVSRRHMLSLAALSAVALKTEKAEAVQGMVAGRLPGLGPEDADGYRKYTRLEGKSGGHGVGWSEFDPYSFKVPDGWEEVPVSIADLGGTEIDLRFSNPSQGNISVVVAPILRFADLGDNPTINMIGSPEKVINAFGPEVIGQVVDDKIIYAKSERKEDRKLYYQFELNPPHLLMTATAASNRLYLFNVSATSRQWKKAEPTLRKIADSFRVAKR